MSSIQSFVLTSEPVSNFCGSRFCLQHCRKLQTQVVLKPTLVPFLRLQSLIKRLLR